MLELVMLVILLIILFVVITIEKNEVAKGKAKEIVFDPAVIHPASI
jgi:hypothetical protein